MTKLEMCDSTSTDSACNNPVTIGTGESSPIDIASTNAGAAAASYGNLGLGKFGTTYTYFQITMKRAFTVKGSAKDGAGTTCITAEDGDSSTAAEGAANGGTPAEVTLYAGFVGDSGDGLTLRMNSVADANGGTPAVAGTIADNSEFFQYREKLDTTLTLKAGVIPTVKIAFGTATALEAVGNMGNCTQNIAAQVGFIAGEPDVSITFE